MPYLVDGNNLLGFLSGKPRPSEEEKQRLLRLISDRLRAVRSRVLVVFDGPSGTGMHESSLGQLSIRYSGNRSADDVITEIAGRSLAPSDQHVVTDDRGLASRVREAGARTLSAGEFWARFGGRETRSEPAAVDVQDWIEFFSDDQNRIS